VVAGRQPGACGTTGTARTSCSRSRGTARGCHPWLPLRLRRAPWRSRPPVRLNCLDPSFPCTKRTDSGDEKERKDPPRCLPIRVRLSTHRPGQVSRMLAFGLFAMALLRSMPNRSSRCVILLVAQHRWILTDGIAVSGLLLPDGGVGYGSPVATHPIDQTDLF
jgi:hypothetical protein